MPTKKTTNTDMTVIVNRISFQVVSLTVSGLTPRKVEIEKPTMMPIENLEMTIRMNNTNISITELIVLIQKPAYFCSSGAITWPTARVNPQFLQNFESSVF